MSRETTAANQDVQSILARLDETVGRIDADDLSGLAQMHGWCESLLEMAKHPQSDDSLPGEVLAKLTHELEALILGEVVNAAEAFASIVANIRQMHSSGPQAGDPEAELASPDIATGAPAIASEDLDFLDADQVAESLARVFDDVPGQSITALPEPDLADLADLTNLSDPSDVVPEFADEPSRDADVSDAAPDAAPAAQSPEARKSAAAIAPYTAEPLVIDTKELEFVKGFVEEAREHIEAIEAAVLEVERCPDDTAKIDDLFRPFHTIKGMAGFLNLRDINCLTHEAETLLDQGRKGQRTVTPGVIDLILGVVDVLKVQVTSIGQWLNDPDDAPVAQPPVAEVIDRLRGVVAGSVNPDEEQDAAACPRAATPSDSSAGSAGAVVPPSARPAASAPEGGGGATASAAAATGAAAGAKLSEQSIRIDTEKLDALIDMVGELVIAQTLVNMSDDVAGNPKLSKDVTQVTKIVRDVQELAMAMRMVPIGPTFQKMARLVRDVSRKAGKQVNLTISGEDTELDKTVIQEIGDPLVHMVRNAVDHGVESPEDRRRAGKPETGAVHLHAGHEGGNIVISISDDGKGLNPAVLIAKAIEKGVIEPGTELTDQQAFALVFAPGFSTAAQVTDISGRGVGMDVVKRNIEQLRGRVEITSEQGKGTVFTIRLPLTLAIIDGMVIRTGRERFILPTITIQQSLRPQPEVITTIQHRGEVLNVRGELIPLIQLGELFGLTGRIDPCQAMVIIAHCEGRLVGLVVEELIGQQQVVIKTLGERFEKLNGISGAAILGDGRVGLILETSGLSAANDLFTRRSQVASSGTGPEVTEEESKPQPDRAADIACKQENHT